MYNSGDAAKNYLQKEVEILRTKNHWKKAYFYLWDEVWSQWWKEGWYKNFSNVFVRLLRT